MTTTEATTTSKDYTRTVRALLDQAENTDFEAEAETFRQKAYELMEKHSLTDTMINDAAQVERDELVSEEFFFTGRFADANLLMSYYVASAFGMRGTKATRTNWSTGEERKVMRLYGFASDMEKFKVLNASLQIQAVRAMKEWERSIDLRNSYLSQWDKFKARRAYLTGFGTGVQTKLLAAKRTAEAEVVRERAAADGVTEEETSTGVALVLRNRAETVDDWYDEMTGNVTKKRKGRSFSNRGAGFASQAGRAAGQRADTGQGGLGNRKRALQSR